MRKNGRIKKKDLIDLIQCYYRTRDCSDYHILKRSDENVDKIAQKYASIYNQVKEIKKKYSY